MPNTHAEPPPLFSGPMLLALTLALSAFALHAPPAIAAETLPSGSSCTSPDQEATVADAPRPTLPELASEGIRHDVTVRIELSREGRLEDATIARSSGQPEFDQEALRVVRAASFTPAIADCQPVPSTYLYEVSFDQDP
jgi:protein TonB